MPSRLFAPVMAGLIGFSLLLSGCNLTTAPQDDGLVETRENSTPDAIDATPAHTDTSSGDDYIRTLPGDNRCYFFPLMIGAPIIVYTGPDRASDRNTLPIDVPAEVYLPVDARSEYRLHVSLPDGQQGWAEEGMGILEGVCDGITQIQTIQPPPDDRCYVRVDLEGPLAGSIDDRPFDISEIPRFEWLLVDALDVRDGFVHHYRVVLDDGRQMWLLVYGGLEHGDCTSLPVVLFDAG